jgi:hypothetical protein
VSDLNALLTRVREAQATDVRAPIRELLDDIETLLAANVRPHRRAPLPPERKCDCGHADTTHNDLGYCQAKGREKFSDRCDCDTFENDHLRARNAEYHASRQARSDAEHGD